ncbi:MAG: hypothetical protein OHK0038_22880 [Flammeovirgaceae bacterium]
MKTFMIFKVLFILLIGSAFTYQLHPIHISVTDIEYNQKSQSLEITHKIFIDDFEKDLEEIYQKRLHLGTEKEPPDCEQLIKKYIEERFLVKINNKPQVPQFVGRESDLEAIWIYQEIPFQEKITHLIITNKVLIPYYNDQRNIIHFKYFSYKGSVLTTKDEESGELKIE